MRSSIIRTSRAAKCIKPGDVVEVFGGEVPDRIVKSVDLKPGYMEGVELFFENGGTAGFLNGSRSVTVAIDVSEAHLVTWGEVMPGDTVQNYYAEDSSREVTDPSRYVIDGSKEPIRYVVKVSDSAEGAPPGSLYVEFDFGACDYLRSERVIVLNREGGWRESDGFDSLVDSIVSSVFKGGNHFAGTLAYATASERVRAAVRRSVVLMMSNLVVTGSVGEDERDLIRGAEMAEDLCNAIKHLVTAARDHDEEHGR